MRILLLTAFLAAPAFAQCPDVPDRTDDLAALFTAARVAPDAQAAAPIAAAMWAIWTRAPDRIAQDLLDEGMRRRASYDFLGANAAFDRLVDYCPDYAEGYNQRAFVAFLRQDFQPALDDLDAALDRNPLHVAALSGKALTLMGLGREAEAQDTLRRALTLNPWIPERGLLKTEEDTF